MSSNVKWAKFALWAPSAIHANGKYYLFFGANDIQSDQEDGGIGVAVADRPGSVRRCVGQAAHRQVPQRRPADRPVRVPRRRRPILPVLRRLEALQHRQVERRPVERHALFRTERSSRKSRPTNYVEGPFVFKRQGKYYLMWSEGGWGGPNYSVAYAMADSPLVPSRESARCFSRIRRRHRRGASFGHPGPRFRHVVHRLSPPSARHEGRQPSRSVHRRDALQCRRHDPAGADHVRRREGEAAARGPLDPIGRWRKGRHASRSGSFNWRRRGLRAKGCASARPAPAPAVCRSPSSRRGTSYDAGLPELAPSATHGKLAPGAASEREWR